MCPSASNDLHSWGILNEKKKYVNIDHLLWIAGLVILSIRPHAHFYQFLINEN